MLRDLNAERILGTPRVGVPASSVPATGTDGPGYLYPWLQERPEHAAALVRGRITTQPAAGVLVADEDSGFIYTPAGDGLLSFAFQPYADGLAIGAPVPVELNSGPETATYDLALVPALLGVQLSALALDYMPPEADAYALGIVPVAIGIQVQALGFDYLPPAQTYDLAIVPAAVAVELVAIALDYLPPAVPTTEPITLAQARLHLKIDAEPGEPHPDDALVLDLIAAARQYAEMFTGVAYVGVPQPVPPLVIAAMKVTLGHLYANRDDPEALANLPGGVHTLLWPFRTGLGV